MKDQQPNHAAATGTDVLRDFLARRDTPCPNCGYNLRGLATARCPECNQEVALHIALAQPRFSAWITCVLSLASVGGLFFLGLLMVLLISTSRGLPDGEEFDALVIYPLGASLLCLPPCAFLITQRGRRWLRERTAIAWVVAACVSVPALLVFAWAAWVQAAA